MNRTLALLTVVLALSCRQAPKSSTEKMGAQFPPPATPAFSVDLRTFGVVANNTAKAASNTAAINTALATYSGTHAQLTLPNGLIYIDRSAGGGNKWSIEISGTDEVLAGQGMFATTLVRYGAGDLGSSHEIHIDGAQRIELRDFGIRQDQILSPDPGQQNHLITVTNGSTDIYGHDLYFGQSIGDQLRYIGGTGGPGSGVITNVRFSHFLMHGAGVVTSSPGNGRIGSRSGLAVQDGFNRVSIDHFYIDGVENSMLDFEPTDNQQMDYFDIDSGFIDNSLASSLTAHAASVGGQSGGTLAKHVHMDDVTIYNGELNVFQTADMELNNITIITNAIYPSSEGAEYLLKVRSENDDLLIHNAHLVRAGTSANSDVLNVINTGNRTTIEGGLFEEDVDGYPIYVQNSDHTTIHGVTIKYGGPTPASFVGIDLYALGASMTNTIVDGVNAWTASGKLSSTVQLSTHAGETMSNVTVHNIKSAGYSSIGVAILEAAGSTFDTNPLIQAIDNGTDAAWTETDSNDAPITTIYPIVAGGRGTGTTRRLEGLVVPGGNVNGNLGDTYAYSNTTSSAKVYIKTSESVANTPDSTGWVLVGSTPTTCPNGQSITAIDGNGTGTCAAISALSTLSPTSQSETFDEQLVPGANNTIVGTFEYESVGTGAVVLGTGDQEHPGINQYQTGTTTTGRSSVMLKQSGNSPNTIRFGTEQYAYDILVRIPTLCDNTTDICVVRCGFEDSTSAEAADGAFFKFDPSASAHWRIVTANATTLTEQDTSTTVVANTWYHLGATVNSSGTSVTFTVNGSSVGTSTSNIPTGASRQTSFGCTIIKSAGTTMRDLDVDYLYMIATGFTR